MPLNFLVNNYYFHNADIDVSRVQLESSTTNIDLYNLVVYIIILIKTTIIGFKISHFCSTKQPVALRKKKY